MYEGVQYHLLDFVRRCSFGPESSFKCEPIRILTIWKCIRSKILDQKCIFEANLTRDTELFQIVFWTQNVYVVLQQKLILSRNDPLKGES